MIDTKKFFPSFRYAFAGILWALRHNQNLRIHVIVGFFVVITSIVFQVDPFEMGILGVMILLVVSAEMVNTAIEQMVDFVVSEHKREAKVAKDVSAGMVLLTAIGSVVVGILIFAPHIVRFFR